MVQKLFKVDCNENGHIFSVQGNDKSEVIKMVQAHVLAKHGMQESESDVEKIMQII